MTHRFSSPQIERMKRSAKDLRRADSSLTHMEALNQIARENGWIHWAALAKDGLPAADSQLSFGCRWLSSEGESMRLQVEMAITDKSLCGEEANQSPSFSLPDRADWLFREAECAWHYKSPYLDLESQDARGVFLDGRWQAILATNGCEVPAYTRVEATLAPLLRDLKASAFGALLPRIATIAPTAGYGNFRLFYAKAGEHAVPEIGERNYGTLDAASESELPEGCLRIGIPLPSGTWLRL